MIVARDEARLAALAEALGGVAHLATDVLDPEALVRALEFARVRYGRLDGAVHCVGLCLKEPAHRTDLSTFDALVRSNLTSAFSVVKASTTVMRRAGGSVVFVASSSARAGLPDEDGFAAVKAGVIGLARAAAATYADRGMRFNVVAPDGLHVEGDDAQGVAVERVGQSIAHLLDPHHGAISGEVLGLDGGRSMLRRRR